MAAILDLPKNEAFPKVDSGGVLRVFSHSANEYSYVENHLLTFL